jgi:hypothetical protein
MPVQNYGAIMQGAADLTAMPANAFAQGQSRRQAQDYRNSLLGMDQQRLTMDQQKFDAEQEDDEEDRALYAAWAKGDWATADAIDPVSTMGYRMKQAELQKMQTPEAPKRDIRTVGGTLLEVPQDGAPQVLYQAPEKPQAPQKPGYGAPQAGVNPQTGKPDQYVVDDMGGVKWLGVQPVEQGPKPIEIAKTRKEFRALPSVKDYETALPLLVSARKAPDNGYGDLQLIYTAGKILDPGSVVREGELALTVAAGSPLQRAIGQTRFTTENGGRLTPETRKQLLGMLNERVLAYRQAYDRDYQQYAEYAQSGGMVPRDVVGRHAANAYQPTKPAAPTKKQAPAAAVEYLKSHPETKAAFKAKYGYLPE